MAARGGGGPRAPCRRAPTARQEVREAQAIQDQRSIWSPTHSSSISETTEELASTKNIAHATKRKKEKHRIPGREKNERTTVGERMSKPKGHLPALTEGRLVGKDTLTHLQGARSSPSLSRGRSTGPRETATGGNGQHGYRSCLHLKLFLSSRPPAVQVD